MSYTAQNCLPITAGRKKPRTLLQKLQDMRALARQRQHLGTLDTHLLQDIGITRTQAENEAGKPSWQAPAHWRD